jgi:DNA polymerase-3 subunit epsilon
MKPLIYPLAFIDVETTGGNSSSRVLEIGVIRVENNRIVDQFETILDPLGYVPPIITEITGITSDDIEHAPQFESIVPRLLEIFDGAIFTAHNVSFDFVFVSREFAKQHTIFQPPQLCTVKLSRRLFPQYRKHSLEAIIERHNIHVTDRHRALADADAMWQFYQIILQEFDLDTIEQAMNHQFKNQVQTFLLL